MARDIKTSWTKYIPKWDGNDRDKDPISVEIRPLTHRAMNDVLAMGQGKIIQEQDQYVLSEKIFCENVKECKNLSVNGKAVVSPEDLWSKAPFALTGEILTYLTDQSQLSTNEKKT